MEKTRWSFAVCDHEWRLVWVSEDMKVLVGEHDEDKLGYGKHILECWTSDTWHDTVSEESHLSSFFDQVPYILFDTPGGADALMNLTDDAGRPAIDLDDPVVQECLAQIGASEESIFSVEPQEPPPLWVTAIDYIQEGFEPETVKCLNVRLHDNKAGSFLGTLMLYGSSLPARILSLVARGDEGMYERMSKLVRPGRRQAAVLFADLQESGVLSRRLPSAAYFKLVAGITSAIDDVVTRRCGIIGKHAGDGATAFFLVDDAGSPSAAARTAIEAAREIAEVAGRTAKAVGDETGLQEAADLRVNVGVHWGGTLYMGQLVTGNRLEVTALGDAVNEGARIQESARDGEAFASKSLIEHLSAEDAAALGLDPDVLLYRTIAELASASDKAKRDAGGIPVTVL